MYNSDIDKIMFLLCGFIVEITAVLFLQMLLASRSVLKGVQIADFIKKYVYKVKKLTVNFCF